MLRDGRVGGAYRPAHDMHDPGAPPQRPQVGAEPALDFDSAPTAKTLKVRLVRLEPHSGHSIFSRPLIVRNSFSNFVLQL